MSHQLTQNTSGLEQILAEVSSLPDKSASAGSYDTCTLILVNETSYQNVAITFVATKYENGNITPIYITDFGTYNNILCGSAITQEQSFEYSNSYDAKWIYDIKSVGKMTFPAPYVKDEIVYFRYVIFESDSGTA